MEIKSSWFQSAPRCEHRGDCRRRTRAPHPQSFNPRPGANTGATRWTATLRTSNRIVSIRAPVRTPGRRAAIVAHFTPRFVSIRAPVRTPGRPHARPIAAK